VCAFRGWNDAAGSATTALSAITDSLDGEIVAHVDPEEFFDFQVSRPTVHLVEGQSREIEWPGNNLLVARAPGAERDLVLLAGTEPNLRWRTFSEAVADAAEKLGVEMVITLGALLADVTHTMPVPITGLASDEQMVEELGLQRSNYEGPTGIVGILHDSFNKRGISSASLWAAVPHYVAAIPNPKAALALLRRLEGMVGVAVEASGLEEETDSFEGQVSAAVEQNPEIAEMVERLQAEQAEALGEDGEELDLPSADSLAQDFERYLRQQPPEQGGPARE
jgi:proteasome assembly chaperone (PAC2) family protein